MFYLYLLNYFLINNPFVNVPLANTSLFINAQKWQESNPNPWVQIAVLNYNIKCPAFVRPIHGGHRAGARLSS